MTPLPLRLLIYPYSASMNAARVLALSLLRATKLYKQWNIRDRASIPAARANAATGNAGWIHAASLGEAKLLARFLDILRKKHPGVSYVLTAATRTGVEYLDRCEGDDIIAAGYLPFDTIGLMSSMLSAFCITRVWIMETELWPSMIWACRKKGIPIGIVNARIEEKSLVRYLRFKPFLFPLFSYPDIILAQNQTYANRFLRLGIAPERVCVTGNLKSYVTVRRVSREDRIRVRRDMALLENDICITAGCLHPGEGIVIKNALDLLKTMGLKVKCIAVPRHLRDSEAIFRELGNETLRTKDIRAPRAWDICLVEKIGILEAMYKIADAAVVGGTFDATGGHNMWDAAQFGIPVFFGSNFRTQQESADMLSTAGVAFLVKNGQELAAGATTVLRDRPREFQNALSVFVNEINKKCLNIEDHIP
jgi:3-deoxy-D-manno-octulosonic-acid transferase